MANEDRWYDKWTIKFPWVDKGGISGHKSKEFVIFIDFKLYMMKHHRHISKNPPLKGGVPLESFHKLSKRSCSPLSPLRAQDSKGVDIIFTIDTHLIVEALVDSVPSMWIYNIMEDMLKSFVKQCLWCIHALSLAVYSIP